MQIKHHLIKYANVTKLLLPGASRMGIL